MKELTISGRVWKFGDDMNTDLMMPGHLLYGSIEEQTRALFSANRPGWANEVRRGDLLVAGRNFGIGSSRPAARSFVNLGITCILAESINGLFMRSCVSYGLLAMECPGISVEFEEGDEAEIRLADGHAKNLRTSRELKVQLLPPELLKIMMSGGILPVLEKRGLISAPSK